MGQAAREKGEVNQKTIAVIGDYVSDVLIPEESRTPLVFAKETTLSGSFEHGSIQGDGGVAYLQQIFKILFQTHFPEDEDKNGPDLYKDNVVNQSLTDEKVDGHLNHWSVAKCPEKLTKKRDLVYRVIERLGQSRKAEEQDERKPINLPEKEDFVGGIPDLLLISDYNRDVRKSDVWEYKYKDWLTNVNDSSVGNPSRVILIGNRLPARILDPKNKNAKEPLWDVLLGRDETDETDEQKEEREQQARKIKRNTLLVTGLDRLRQEGANISKRHSWDATLIDFQREIENFEPLKELAEFGHLIVRIGVVGAIHTYWDKNDERQVRFIYDPSARNIVYRDRALQGNVFAIRSVFPACIAFRIALQNFDIGQGEHISDYDKKRGGAVRLGIQDAIGFSQSLYDTGFGETINEVESYIVNDNREREEQFINLALEAKRKDKWSQAEISDGKPKNWFAHIVRPPSLDECKKENPDWSILADNQRAMLKPDEFKDSGLEEAEVLAKLNKLSHLRRLRMARAIVFLGVDSALNQDKPLDTHIALRRVDKVEYMKKQIRLEEEADKKFRERKIGDISKDEIEKLLFPSGTESLLPLNTPVAVFGKKLKVLNNVDVENYSSIRNLLSGHLSSKSKKSKPLSIAVFGAPGCGKSFGVECIAEEIGGEDIEKFTCNVSQLNQKHDLNAVFVKIAEILSRNKTPLVFFDEFDASVGNDNKLFWLKYFLEPMQDGTYPHPDNVINIGNSILVFAGGCYPNFEEFLEEVKILGGAKPQIKSSDFLSRLHGYINIPGLNCPNEGNPVSHDNQIPYIRRAMILRSMLEQDEELVGQSRVARIDRNIVDAFLRVSKYHHGARSLNAILRISLRFHRRLEKSSLPRKEQLKIHTDADDFLNLVTESEDRAVEYS